MAQFCTKCGSPVGEAMSFCTKCGAVVAPASPSAAQAPVEAVPVVEFDLRAEASAVAATPSTSAAVAAPRLGNPIVKIILIVLSVFVVFGLVGIGSCVYIGYRLRQRVNEFKKEAHSTLPSRAATPEVHTEAAATATTAGTASAVVPIYPGATPTEAGGDMSMGAGIVAVQEYLTDDPVEKVISFYKDKLGSNLNVQEGEGKSVLQSTGSAGVTSVTIYHDENSGKTKFSITRIGK